MVDQEKVTGVQISISPLSPEDIPLLKPILYEHIRNRISSEEREPDVEEIEAVLGYMQGKPDDLGRVRIYFVAKDDTGQVLGCMAIVDPDPQTVISCGVERGKTAELVNAFVSSNFYRGKGVGRKLFEEICAEAVRRGKKYLVLDSGPRYEDSWGFYDKMMDRRGEPLINRYGENLHSKTWIKEL